MTIPNVDGRQVPLPISGYVSNALQTAQGLALNVDTHTVGSFVVQTAWPMPPREVCGHMITLYAEQGAVYVKIY